MRPERPSKIKVMIPSRDSMNIETIPTLAAMRPKPPVKATYPVVAGAEPIPWPLMRWTEIPSIIALKRNYLRLNRFSYLGILIKETYLETSKNNRDYACHINELFDFLLWIFECGVLREVEMVRPRGQRVTTQSQWKGSSQNQSNKNRHAGNYLCCSRSTRRSDSKR